MVYLHLTGLGIQPGSGCGFEMYILFREKKDSVTSGAFDGFLEEERNRESVGAG